MGDERSREVGELPTQAGGPPARRAGGQTAPQPRVGVIMGSDSDWAVMEDAALVLAEFDVPFEVGVVSAHRTPDRMLDYARSATPGSTAIVATETGMLHPLQMAAPDVTFLPANRAAVCQYMKMITLPKLRDALRDLSPVVKVDPALAERARVPIERMVAL